IGVGALGVLFTLILIVTAFGAEVPLGILLLVFAAAGGDFWVFQKYPELADRKSKAVNEFQISKDLLQSFQEKIVSSPDENFVLELPIAP
ncbi:MAG: hypothetical protein JNJ49_00175, partial [Bdellovibrionaceae bacterium]|nr:hypothetical protein [Pseudobdellovibrionaceae bacterium]